MKPTIGRIVHFTLTEQQAWEINRRRTTSKSIADRLSLTCDSFSHPATVDLQPFTAWPAGAQAHIGNKAKAGDVYPAMIVRTWGDSPDSCVQLQVFLDGNDTFWATSVNVGTEPGTYAWPSRE